MSVSTHRSLARRARKEARGLGWFFALLLLVGLGLLCVHNVRPALQMLSARTWQERPCVIESSQVISQPASKGATHGVEVVYRYLFDGREYTSRRYNFAVGATVGRASKDKVVQAYRPGLQTVCYVNPIAPQQAVLSREMYGGMGFGFLGLILALVGGLGMTFAPRRTGDEHPPHGCEPRAEPEIDGPVLLKPLRRPLTKFLRLLALCIVWSGFLGFLICLEYFMRDAHQTPLFAKIISTILTLVGVGLIFWLMGAFLALFNPRLRLRAPTTTVPLGGTLHLTWTIRKRAEMLRKLRLVLEGREEAIFEGGRHCFTHEKVFAEIPVFESADRALLTAGRAQVTVPADLMHTFEAKRNKVLWRLKVHGEIPYWPDMADEYAITVRPLPLPH